MTFVQQIAFAVISICVLGQGIMMLRMVAQISELRARTEHLKSAVQKRDKDAYEEWL